MIELIKTYRLLKKLYATVQNVETSNDTISEIYEDISERFRECECELVHALGLSNEDNAREKLESFIKV